MKTKIQNIDASNIEVKLHGELDTLAAEQFANDLQPLMDDASKTITMDFQELEYISSAGMRTLLLLQRTAMTKGGKVRIKGMSDEIKQIFQLTGFDTMMEIL